MPTDSDMKYNNKWHQPFSSEICDHGFDMLYALGETSNPDI
jgi:hypothetical protein